MDRFAWVLSGDTFPHREEIRLRGFTWQERQRVWAREIPLNELRTQAEMNRWLKTLRGVTVTEERADRYIVGSRRWYR